MSIPTPGERAALPGAAAQSRKAGSLRRLSLDVLKHARLRALLALIFLLLGSLTEGGALLLLIPVLQLGAFRGETVTLHTPALLADRLGPVIHLTLLPLLAGVVLLVAVQTLFNGIKNLYLGGMLYDYVADLRMKLFESVGQARWKYIARLRGSDLNHLLTTDVERVQEAAYNLFFLVQNLILLMIYVAVSWLISPPMTLFAAAVGGVAFALLHPIRRYATTYGAGVTEQRRRQFRTVSDFLGGIKVAKSMNAEPRYFAELRSTLGALRSGYMRYVRLNLVGTVVFQVSAAAGLAAFVYVALTRYAMPLPQIVVLILLFARLSPRFQALQTHLQEMLTSVPAFDSVCAVRAACDAEREPLAATDTALPPLEREIRFEGVTFSYSDTSTEAVLKDVSFHAPARQVTAIIGASGSGKSTLADLLMGLLEPTAGRVTIDAVALDERTRRPWRGRIAYVPQDVLLLHDSVAANLRLAAPEADEAAMWEALTGANAHEFVGKLPDGLNTVLADRGVRLSGGERQRIALARALLRQPELLVLDEATSALDWENQALIAQSIESLRGSMTVITIAHRPSMIAFADWVVALDAGRVVESGRYEELARRADSRLAQLVASEQGKFTAEARPGA